MNKMYTSLYELWISIIICIIVRVNGFGKLMRKFVVVSDF